MALLSQVFFEAPPASLFKLPDVEPQTIPPPHISLPFTIPDHVYRAALDPKVPITIACLYAATVKALNIYNKSTGKSPWAISQSTAFRAFVIAHNIFLAVYSAWTFWGMLTALRHSVVSPMGPNGFVGTVDSLCKLHGTPGLENSVTFDQSYRRWVALENPNSLVSEFSPSRTDGGRIWNEGLAFYGWIFYLSKFYEVLDTFVILAKGKLSSTLQTYHHAGAMMCMWAGMRYMSAPIWMFVFFNSGIHAVMYTYYTITAFNIRVPTALKRILTSLQITQFIVGASYAVLHSFIYYTVPVQIRVAQSTDASTESVGADRLVDSMKRIVLSNAESINSISALSSEKNQNATSVAYNTHYQTVSCISTTGATFAIWLNILYLAPLTYLFVSFFIVSYVKRTNAKTERGSKLKANGHDRNPSGAMTNAEKAGWDAARSIEQEVYGPDGAEVSMDRSGRKH